MSKSARKTYFAAPNFECTPDGLIQLGQIISDHKNPQKAICEPLTPLPKVYSSYFDDWEKEKSRSFEGSIGIFAQCLAALIGLGGDASANFAREDSTLLKFRKLETFIISPPKDYIEDSMRRSLMQDYLREHPRNSSLFMITGLKIARGAECTKANTRGVGVETNLGADLTEATGVPISVGPKGSISRHRKESETFSGSSDFVFAYKMCRIFVQQKTQAITGEDYTKGAVYADDLDSWENMQSAPNPEVLDPRDDEFSDNRAGAAFDFGADKEDLGSAFLPPGFTAVDVVDENDEPCRLVYQGR